MKFRNFVITKASDSSRVLYNIGSVSFINKELLEILRILIPKNMNSGIGGRRVAN